MNVRRVAESVSRASLFRDLPLPMIDPSGKTQLNLAPVPGATGSREDDLFRAVRDVVASEYELLGELGRGTNASVVYLAREVATGNLVALKLERGPSGGDADYELSVVPQLDESIPSAGSSCPYCARRVEGWERFCPQCGRDISGEAGASDATAGFTTEELLAAVRESASDQYEVLGEMARARGGGRVYFARDLATGAIVALRLQRDRSTTGESHFSLGRTQVLKPMVADTGAPSASPTPSPRTAPPAANAQTPAPAAAAPPPARPKPPPPDGRTVVELPAAIPPAGASPYAAAPPPAVVDADVEVAEPTPANRRRTLLIAGGVLVALIGAVALSMTGGDDTGIFNDSLRPDSTAAVKDSLPSGLDSTSVVVQPDTSVVRPPTATVLRVTGALPAGVTILIDGRRISGRQTTIAAGSHLLVARAEGFTPFTERLDIAGDTVTWSPRLRRIEPRPDSAVRVVVDSTPKAPAPTCARSVAAQDWTAARTLCRRDAGAGDPAAQRQYGLLLIRGNGGPVDEAGAVNWLRMAGDRDDAQALYELGRIHQTRRAYRDDRRAFDLFRRAALRGNADAQLQAGRMLEHGIGTGQNHREAFLMYEQGAKAGHAGAQNAYGVFLKKGIGTRRDDVKALEWLMKAAQGGSPEAHFHVGEMHEQGRGGLPRSRAAAVEWYRKGAALGSEEARRALRN